MTRADFSDRITTMQDTLYRVAYGLFLNPQDVSDAVQECILKAWDKRHTLRDESYFQTWVIRILINECKTIMRKRKPTWPIEAVPEAAAQTSSSNQALYEAIAALPEALRLVITLHYIEGYREAELAAMLTCPLGTVKSRLRKARLLLKDLLRSEGRHHDA